MKIVAQGRTSQGTGASRRLRNAGQAPGIVYGADEPPQLISLDQNALWQATRKEAFHSSILEMELSGKTSHVLLRDLQLHPYRQEVLHVDFQRVSATHEIHVNVPLHYTGAEDSQAVKVDKCFIDYILNEVEVRCLPANLPERITVDLSGVKQGDNLTLADVTFPEGVKPALRGRKAEDLVLITVVTPAEEEASEPAAAPAAAPAPAAPAGGAAAAPQAAGSSEPKK